VEGVNDDDDDDDDDKEEALPSDAETAWARECGAISDLLALTVLVAPPLCSWRMMLTCCRVDEDAERNIG
jgi:hypothetical protein